MTDADFVSITRNGQLCDEEGGLGPQEFDQVMREQVRVHTLQSLSIDPAFMLPHEEAFSRRGSAKMILMELQRLGDALDRMQPGIWKLDADTVPCKHSVGLKPTTLLISTNRVSQAGAVVTGQNDATTKPMANVGDALQANDDLAEFMDPTGRSQNTSTVEMASAADLRLNAGQGVSRSPFASNASGVVPRTVESRPKRLGRGRAADSVRRPWSGSASEVYVHNTIDSSGSVGKTGHGESRVDGRGGGSTSSQTLKQPIVSAHANLGLMKNSVEEKSHQPLARQKFSRPSSEIPLATAHGGVGTSTTGEDQRQGKAAADRRVALSTRKLSRNAGVIPTAKATVGTWSKSFCDCSARPSLNLPLPRRPSLPHALNSSLPPPSSSSWRDQGMDQQSTRHEQL